MVTLYSPLQSKEQISSTTVSFIIFSMYAMTDDNKLGELHIAFLSFRESNKSSEIYCTHIAAILHQLLQGMY